MVYLANVFFLVVALSDETGSLVVLYPPVLKGFTLVSLIKLLFLSPLLYSNLGVKVAANLFDLSTRSLNYWLTKGLAALFLLLLITCLYMLIVSQKIILSK